MTTVLRKTAIVVAVATIGLAGCTGVKESLGAAKQSPDETAITTRAPWRPTSRAISNPNPREPPVINTTRSTRSRARRRRS